MTQWIRTGGLLVKGPAESEVYVVDWDTEHLAPSVTLTLSNWTLTLISGAPSPVLTHDNDSIIDAARKTQTRLIGGVQGQLWDISNTVTTSESPPRIKDRSFFLSIEDR